MFSTALASGDSQSDGLYSVREVASQLEAQGALEIVRALTTASGPAASA